jgi:hypothetical protein
MPANMAEQQIPVSSATDKVDDKKNSPTAAVSPVFSEKENSVDFCSRMVQRILCSADDTSCQFL